MELKIKKGDCLNLLKWSQGIAEKRGTMPILSNLLLETGGESLKVTATDLEVVVTAEEKAEVKSDGRVTVNARNLYEIIRESPEEVIRFQKKGDHGIEISSGKARFRVLGMNVDEFPSLPAVSQKGEVGVESDELMEMIEKTFYAASSDETRYTLNGLYLTNVTRGDRVSLRLVATDGHRLSYSERETAGKWNLPRGIIIPRKGIAEVKNLLANGEGDLFVAIEEKVILFRRGKVSLIIRLIEGDFPAYEQVIPKKTDRIVSVGRDEITGALRRAAIMTSETAGRGVKFAFSAGRLEISSSSPDLGEASEEIPIDYKGANFQVGFNPRYFLDLLGVLNDEKVVLELKDEVSPCLVRSEFDRGFLALVMPMRI